MTITLPDRLRRWVLICLSSDNTNEINARNVPIVATISAVDPNHSVETNLTFSSGKSATSKPRARARVKLSLPVGKRELSLKHHSSRVPQTIAVS